MSVTKKAFYCLALLAAIVALPSCGGDNAPDRAPTIYDIVELTEMDKGVTEFALYGQESALPVRLNCRGEVIDTTVVHVGDALYLAYRTCGQLPGESGQIEPVGYSRVNNITLKQAAADGLAGWDADRLEVVSLWRGGTQVYMRLRLPYDEDARLFSLIVDKETIDRPVPDAYLYHARDTEAPTYMRQYYVAVQLAPLWKRTGIEALNIHISTEKGQRCFTIEKP